MIILKTYNKNTVNAKRKTHVSLAWVLFLGVIPFDKAALTLYLNPVLGEYISYALNAITFFVTVFLILNGSTKKNIKNTLCIKYVCYFVFLFFLYLISALISSEILISRILSLFCLLAYYLFVIFNYNNIYDLLQDINVALLVIVFISFILYLMKNPNVFYTENASTVTFKGIVSNRNSYAEISLFLITGSFCLYKNRRKFLPFAISVGFALYTTLLTNSATAIICVLLLFGGLLLVGSEKIAKHLSVALFAFVYLVIFVFLILFRNTDVGIFKIVTGIFNKSSTFTGRVDLWSAAINAISQRPIFGYGYDSDILLSYGVQHADPHNSILYVLLTGGVIGFLGFVVMVFSVFSKNKNIKLRTNYMHASMSMFFMIWLLRGLVESGCSYSHFIFWVAIIILDRVRLENEENTNAG